jgi:Skp family chaperone for outer membrane proteins
LKEPVVKKSFLVAAIVMMTLAVSSSARAQGQVDRGVAVVDLKYIFDNFPLFLAEKEKVDKDIKAAEDEVVAEKKNLETLKTQRDECKKTSPEYASRDAQLTRAGTELQVKVTQTRKRFVEREATLYMQAYKTIVAEVGDYAAQRGYSMVLRYNKDLLGDPDDAGDARKVAQVLNKPVVWIRPNTQNIYDPNNRDITNGVLEVLKQRYQGVGAAQRPGVPHPQQH